MRVFSLRGHRAPVSNITQSGNDLVTADRDGHVIVWDLITKRCKAIWRAHDGHIVTLEKTQWGLLTHGRDSCIRIWKGPFDKLTNDVSILSLTPPKPGPSTQSLLHPETKSNLPAPDHFEIPVNSLNFCNVAVCGNIIATSATRDSERFDIYQISASLSLLRLVENHGELLEDTLEGTRTGTGIIMRLLFVSESLLFAGYESGRVRGYRLKRQNVDSVGEKSRLVMNKDMKVTMVMDEAAHVPQPVLTLEYDARKQLLYTGSASKKLKVYSVRHLVGTGNHGTEDFGNDETEDFGESEIGKSQDSELSLTSNPDVFNLRHYGIQSLIVGSNIIAGFWDGNVLIFTQELEKLTELERQEEFIQPENEKPDKITKKLVCLHLWRPENSATLTTRKSQMRSRKLSSDPLLFVGHGDGLVSAYSLK